jgi:succinate dehydrogenase flavin-adding protein (antitoxin of CptAB toxin-antitoxin module)
MEGIDAMDEEMVKWVMNVGVPSDAAHAALVVLILFVYHR